jgi:mono/diheme cytochrome c family protein
MVSADARDAADNVSHAAAVTVTVNNVAATTLSELQSTIFSPRCSGCHNGGGGALPGSMNLSSTAASYAALVGIPSVEQPDLLRVKPNDPPNSYLVRKLEGGPGITGDRMPQFGPYLTTAEMDKVKSWINAGALNN